MTRELCRICLHENPVGFVVPDSIWDAVVPEDLRNSVVCLSCFASIGDDKMIDWDRDIQFFPVSRASFHAHLKSDGTV